MRIYSSKKVALNNVNVTDYKTGLQCTGQYKTTIKSFNVTEYKDKDKIVALYKTYHKDYHGRYVKIHYIKEVKTC